MGRVVNTVVANGQAWRDGMQSNIARGWTNCVYPGFGFDTSRTGLARFNAERNCPWLDKVRLSRVCFDPCRTGLARFNAEQHCSGLDKLRLSRV